MSTRDPLRETMMSVACLITISVAGAAWADGYDWPQFRGPNRDGISAETGLLREWPEAGPRQLFSAELGEGYSAISVSGGRLYTLFAGAGGEFVICLDAADGSERWRHRLDSKWEDKFGNGPRSTPTLDGDLVFALGAKGKLVALGAADGKLVWERDLQEDFGAKPPRWGVSTSPLVEAGRLLVDVGGKNGASIVAFNKKNGREVWRSQEGAAGYSAPIAVTVGGVRQVLFFTAKQIVSLSPMDGALFFKLPWKTSYDVNAATPVFVAPDKVFFSSGYDTGSVLLRIKIDGEQADFEELWRSREMKNKFSSSVLRGDYLYGFDEGIFKCLKLEDGSTVWRQRGFGHGSLLFADGYFIVLGDEGKLALVEATPEEYREKSSFQLFQGKSWTMPTLVNGILYLRDEKRLVALKISG